MNDFFTIITNEREWSWSIIGLALLAAGLILRALLLKPILHPMKIRNKSWYQRSLHHYGRKSILGWILFFSAVFGTIFLWRFEGFFSRRYPPVIWLLIFFGLYLLSLLCHLQAYGRSIVEALEENVATDKDI